MFNNLWIFGDSYSDVNYETVPYREWYNSFMGYETEHFSKIISEKLNLNIINLAVGGSDNDSIFEKIIDNIDNFKEGDLILVNWSTITRFRLTSINNNSTTMSVNIYNSNIDIDRDCLIKICNNRDSEIFINQVLKWTKLLKHAINKRMVFWSPFIEFKNTEILTITLPLPENCVINYNKYEKMGVIFNDENWIINPEILGIKGHTNGNVGDLHYSEIAHMLLSEYILNEIGL
jgi:hypothetical protein